MHFPLKNIAVLLVVASTAGSAAADSPRPASQKATTKEIVQFMRVSGILDSTRLLVPAWRKEILAAMRDATPGLTSEQIEVAAEAVDQVLSKRYGDLNVALTQYYWRSLSREEVLGLTEILSSQRGNRLMQKLTAVSMNSAGIFTEFGRAAGEEAAKAGHDKLRARGDKF